MCTNERRRIVEEMKGSTPKFGVEEGVTAPTVPNLPLFRPTSDQPHNNNIQQDHSSVSAYLRNAADDLSLSGFQGKEFSLPNGHRTFSARAFS